MGEAVDMAEAVSMEGDSQGQAPAESSGCTPCDGGLAGDDGGVNSLRARLQLPRRCQACACPCTLSLVENCQGLGQHRAAAARCATGRSL